MWRGGCAGHGVCLLCHSPHAGTTTRPPVCTNHKAAWNGNSVHLHRVSVPLAPLRRGQIPKRRTEAGSQLSMEEQQHIYVSGAANYVGKAVVAAFLGEAAPGEVHITGSVHSGQDVPAALVESAKVRRRALGSGGHGAPRHCSPADRHRRDHRPRHCGQHHRSGLAWRTGGGSCGNCRYAPLPQLTAA